MKLILKEIFSQKTTLSSKRVFGSICLLFSMVVVTLSMCIDPYGSVDDSILYTSIQFLGAGCALLGSTLFEKNSIKKNFEKNKTEETD